MWHQLDSFDRNLMVRMHHLPYTGLWRLLSRQISLSGDGAGYFLFALLIAGSGGARGLDFLLVGLAAFAIELPVYWLLKNSLKRARPSHGLGLMALVEPHDKFSLPSGHSAAAFVMAGLLAWYWPPLALVAYGWASLVALSRVMLAVHYPGDVLAGAALGTWSIQVALMTLTT